MVDDTEYAVYLHPGALESLGEAITPFLTQGPHGPHLLCTEIDTGGALCEMCVQSPGTEGGRQCSEVMIPIAMIRLVLSVGVAGDRFGFRQRARTEPGPDTPAG